MNKVIVNGLKKRLDEARGKWVDEIPHVLWTYQITPRQSTGETLFSMTYVSEAVILLEIGFLTLRTSLFNLEKNNQLLREHLDLADERRELAMA